ncbi:hypothetical protein K445DRAFT_212926 [Daldinia sp. EC12]|nr:hypothetical protein K445DRAFT_212926 [Daldinia sp. EC12]
MEGNLETFLYYLVLTPYIHHSCITPYIILKSATYLQFRRSHYTSIPSHPIDAYIALESRRT